MHCVGVDHRGDRSADGQPHDGRACHAHRIGASALAKVSLDASLQHDLPEESIASGFGRSETVLQLSWVLGGALGVLLPTEYWIGFTVVSVFLTIGLLQTFLSYRGSSLLPGLGGKRPDLAEQEVTEVIYTGKSNRGQGSTPQ